MTQRAILREDGLVTAAILDAVHARLEDDACVLAAGGVVENALAVAGWQLTAYAGAGRHRWTWS